MGPSALHAQTVSVPQPDIPLWMVSGLALMYVEISLKLVKDTFDDFLASRGWSRCVLLARFFAFGVKRAELLGSMSFLLGSPSQDHALLVSALPCLLYSLADSSDGAWVHRRVSALIVDKDSIDEWVVRTALALRNSSQVQEPRVWQSLYLALEKSFR